MNSPSERRETEMDLTPTKLTAKQNMIRVFYKEVWDKRNIELVPELFWEDFTFRGSLGPVLSGHKAFTEYVLWLTDVLETYTSDIFALIEQGERVAGKLRFHGIHRGVLFGVPPTGRHVAWHGAPIFTFEDGRIRDLWVLGDIHGLLRQLTGASDQLDFAISGAASSV